MKYLLIPLAVLAAASCLWANPSVWFDGSLDDAKAIAQSEDKLIIIDFFSQF